MAQNRHFREFVTYASLNVLGMTGLSCYILADTFFISRGLGANGLTALNLALPVYNLIHGTGLMLGMGGAIRYTICKSKQETKSANLTYTNTLLLAAGAAVLFLLMGLFLSRTFTAALGAGTAVFEMTNTYLKVLLLFAPAFVMNDVLICFVRNDGGPKLTMLAMLGGSFSNVVIDYIFIFPLGMGIFGAVLATGFAPLISMSILSRHWIKKKNEVQLVRTKPELTIVPYVLALGFPSLVVELSSGVVIIVFNQMILSLKGNVGVAAYGVIANLSLVAAAIYTGIAQGIQPLVSRAYGANEPGGVRRTLGYAMTAMLMLSAVIYAVVFFLTDPLAAIFNSENNHTLQELAVQGLRLYFTAIPFAGFNIILSVYFTSTELPVSAHVISLLRGLFVIVPMAFLLSMVWGITGVYLAFPATEILVMTVGASMYYRAAKKLKKEQKKEKQAVS